jgi:hypothetical protein
VRVPWPFARAPRAASGAHGGSAPAGSTAASAGAATSLSPSGAATSRAERAAWRDLPPTRRVIGPPVLTSDRRVFEASRAGSHTLTPVLADIAAAPTLEPVLSSVGAARPMPAPRVWVGGASELTLGRGHVRTDAGAAAAGTGDVDAGPEWSPVEPNVAAPGATSDTVAPSQAAQRAARAATPGTARAPSVDRRSASAPGVGGTAQPLRAPASAPTVRPVSARLRTMTTLAPAQRAAIDGTTVTHGRLDLARPRRSSPANSSETVAQTADRGSSGRSPRGAPLSSAAPTPPNTPRVRRIRLGEPLEPTATRPSMAAAAPLELVGRSRSAGETASPADEPVAADRSRRDDRAGQMSTTPAHVPPGPSSPFASGAASGTGGTGRGTVMPPIVARRPARRVQRAAVHPSAAQDPAAASDQPTAPVATSAADAPVRIDRSSSGAAAASDLRAHAFTSGDTIVLPASHGPLDSGRGRSLLAHELVHVGQQRRLGAALPHESSAAGRRLEQEARSAEGLVETAAASRPTSSPASGLPLARPGARTTGSEAPSSVGSSHGEVSRAVDGALTLAGRSASHGGSGESVSLTASTPVMASSVDDQAIGTQRASANPAPTLSQASGGVRGQDEQELDELARKLYDRLRLRLGRELLLDRERSGLLSGSPR